MTIKEAIERLQCMRLFMKINDKQNDSKFLEDDYIANEMAIKALEEIQQYRAIGTVEELKKAKEQFDNINSYANSIALCGLCDFDTAKESVISTIKAMKDEAKCDGCAGCTVWKCDDANIRAQAIDEFAEALKKHLNEFDFWKYGISDGINYETRNYDHMIDEIAEQLKAGGKE